MLLSISGSDYANLVKARILHCSMLGQKFSLPNSLKTTYVTQKQRILQSSFANQISNERVVKVLGIIDGLRCVLKRYV